MSTTLRQLRTDVAGALTAGGVPGYGHVPERVVPPAAVVLPDQPYIAGSAGDDATMCGTFRVRLRVALLGPKGTNELSADKLDELIVQAAAALDTAPYELEAVAEPAELELNGAGYLGTILTLSTLTTLELLP